MTVRLPFVTAKFELHGSPIPRVEHISQFPFGQSKINGQWKIGPVPVPSPIEAAYYTGLGALAVAELVERPIAAAIAVGTYVAQHTRGDRCAVPRRTVDASPRPAASS
jgi:hypothetical protein